jgi:hypothetical protein
VRVTGKFEVSSQKNAGKRGLSVKEGELWRFKQMISRRNSVSFGFPAEGVGVTDECGN